MSEELVQILHLNVREGKSPLEAALLGVNGEPVPFDSIPAGAYERFARELAGQGYTVVPELTFMPGRSALPRSVAVAGSVEEAALREDIAAALGRAGAHYSFRDGLYRHSSIVHPSLLDGRLWALQAYVLNRESLPDGRMGLLDHDLQVTPLDAFEPFPHAMGDMATLMGRQGLALLLSGERVRHADNYAFPVGIIVATPRMPMERGLFNNRGMRAGLATYRSGPAYFLHAGVDARARTQDSST